MSSGGGDGGGDTVTTIRYAPYIEEVHSSFLVIVSDYRDAVINESPYAYHETFEIAPAFFGTGYWLTDFPSLYDMYGKFMAGLDIEVLFDQSFEDTTNGNIVDELISAQADVLTDDLENDTFPRYEAGMRDINSVISGSFVIGKAQLESKRLKELNHFGAELRYRMIPVAVDRWKTHLEWNKQVVATYADILKFFVTGQMQVENHNYAIRAKDLLWPFTVLDFQRASLGALQGATTSRQGQEEGNFNWLSAAFSAIGLAGLFI